MVSRVLVSDLKRLYKQALIWGGIIALYTVMYMYFYEIVADFYGAMDMSQLSFFGILGFSEINTFDGLVAAMYSNLGPMILGIVVVVIGTGLIAGEEDKRTLEFKMALPLSRTSIVVGKALALIVVILLAMLVTAILSSLGLIIFGQDVETAITIQRLFEIAVMAVPLIAMFGMIGLLLGVLVPERKIAMMIGIIVLIMSFLADGIGDVANIDILSKISPFGYWERSAAIFTESIEVIPIIVFTAISIVLIGISAKLFKDYDIGVGLWPWQRKRK